MKLKAFLISIIIIILLFLISFFSVNLIMKIYVGHRNEVKVPNIIGKNYNVARKQCKKLKLYVNKVDMQHSNEIEKDHIISQKPHADLMTKKNRTIDVVVSKGPEMIRVPYLDNTTLDEAAVRLENAGLKIGKKEYRYNNEVKKNKIIYSVPKADEFVPKGSEIVVVISIGKVPSSGKKEDLWRKLLDKEQ